MKLGVLILAVLPLPLGGCGGPAVAWTSPAPTNPPSGTSRLVVDVAGGVRWVTDSAAAAPRPALTGLCTASVRTIASDDHVYAAWWAVRADSSAALKAAVSSDRGATWGVAITVDTADVSSRGCARPAPSIAASGTDVHVAYAMKSAEGTGVFVAHSMDRGTMFHAPVAVIYGDRLVDVSVAADGNVVALAYEDPNGSAGRIALALSRTQGHMIETHTPASRDGDDAAAPRVAVAGRAVAVAWAARGDTTATPKLVRAGTIEP